MKDQKNRLWKNLSYLYLSFFGSGYSPVAPGTVGSIATIPLILAMSYLGFSFYTVLIITIIIFITSCIIADKIQKLDNVQDPGWIVIDEVVGMLITWLFIFPSVSLNSLIGVFFLFRVFDIVKIWPASFFDRHMKNGFATIFDDVVSALYAGLILYTLNYFHLIN